MTKRLRDFSEVSHSSECGDLYVRQLTFPPTGYWFNLAHSVLIKKISAWLDSSAG